MKSKVVALLLAFALVSGPVSADILSSITSGLNTATNAVSSGLNTATNAVNSGVNTAVNAVGSGLNTAVNATEKGLDTAVNASSNFINTATSSVKDIYNVSTNTVKDFTSDVENALSPAASRVTQTFDNLSDSVVNVTTGTYKGLVQFGRDGQGAPAPASSQSSSNVDATNASSIINAITSNSSGFIQVANSLLVALGQAQSSGVESGIKNVINNSTGNTSYPTSGPNNTISLGLAQAFVTALVTANNYSVTVDYQGKTNTVNSTQVANTFIAGLQDALTPCARNVSNSSGTTSGSNEYFAAIASGCCYLVSQPLTYAAALSESNGVGSQFDTALSNSQLLGQSPSLDLTRCLSNSTTA